MKKNLIIILCFLMGSILLFGCQNSADTFDGNRPIQITVTTGMISDIVKQVGGKHVQVTSLMGPGVDPHLYKASQGDLARLEKADIVFYNGIHLEGKMTDIFEKIGRTKSVVAVSEKINQEILLKTAANQHDPHIWFDVKLWMQAVERVKQALIQFDPKHKQDYEKQADSYLQQLNDLDRYTKQQLASIPKEQRVLVTAHDAFGYFGRAYDVEVVGLQGISTASEYGLKDVSRLVDLLSKRNIKAVFIESSVPKRSIEAVVQGAQRKGHKVVIGGQLFSDAMGQAGTTEGTYVGMVKHNVDTIVKALK